LPAILERSADRELIVRQISEVDRRSFVVQLPPARDRIGCKAFRLSVVNRTGVGSSGSPRVISSNSTSRRQQMTTHAFRDQQGSRESVSRIDPILRKIIRYGSIRYRLYEGPGETEKCMGM